MKATLRSILSSASLIVSLISAIQLLTLNILQDWIWLYHLGIWLTAVLYIALIIVCAMGLWPTYVVGPISSEWDELTTAFADLSEYDILLKELSAVLNATELNAPVVKRYRKLQTVALVLLPTIVVILLLMALIPRV